MTPSLENTVVFLWLQLINPGLPQIVKQKYGSELRNKSVASLKPEISQALPSLLDELRSIEDTKVLRADSYNWKPRPNNRPQNRPQNRRMNKSCILCQTAGRPHSTHWLQDCRFLPDSDKRAMGRSRLVADDSIEECDSEEYFTQEDPESSALIDHPSGTVRRVNVIQSPFLSAYYQHHPVRLTLDTGATTNMILASVAKAINLPVSPASQMARQADGVTPLAVMGEVHCQLCRGDHTFHLDALVVDQLDVDILAGNPFLVANDIATRPAKRQIVIKGREVVHYGPSPKEGASIRRTQAFLVRGPAHQTVVLPGDFVELSTPDACDPDSVWALEPRLDSPANQHSKITKAWPPVQEISSIGHTIRVANTSDEPIMLRRGEHIGQVRSIQPTPSCHAALPPENLVPTSTPKPYSASISVDPDSCLSPAMRDSFHQLNSQYDKVFTPSVSKYNGRSGNIEAVVNMGPVLPPQRKGRLPSYNRDMLIKLQNKFDELETAGVFAKPEQVNVSVEYLNLSFLVQKPSGDHRLVTSFGEVGQYSKPQPSLMPSVDSVLRDIAKWKYIIVTDLLQSFYQIPLAHSSMKYCGVSTPFKGIRVYTRSAMGMPGSETCLEELMSRVLGDLILEGCVAKIADDLYCGGDTPDEALSNWSRVLEALSRNNLRLSARKTVICPKSTTILGWIWGNGTLSASPHRLSMLSSVSPPQNVQGLRSFIGAYKVLSRVLPGYAVLLDPLDQAAAGKPSKDKIQWTDDLLHSFHAAQAALINAKTITMPQLQDHLWIVTDGSVKNRGIAATMYVLRGKKLLLAGFYSCKLRKHQVTWLPCEIEALAIGAAVRHFSPYIIQSKHIPQVLTDSRPCVQAYAKLRRGEFSASSRVTSFLSIVSRYHAEIRHVSGVANLPSDYASRNTEPCVDQTCQVCKFVQETEDSVVRTLTVGDIIEGSAKMPFTSRAAWSATQQECPDLRRTHSYLTQGTRPTKKMTKVPDVKRYLRNASIANDGLLIVREDPPFHPTRERIIVPRAVLDGLLTALHFRFNHPTVHQMRQLFSRNFYALDIDKGLNTVCSSCHHCASLKSIPHALHPQTSTPPPDVVGVSFAADVMRRYRQYILVIRETVSSFTLTKLLPSEKHADLQIAILLLCAEVRSLGHSGITIRVDPAPGLVALVNDSTFRELGIKLEVGRPKNVNKNPVAERAIEELGLECLHLSPEGGPISELTLALATANMNARIRKGGLSAREVWTQRDQISGEQLPLVDKQLILHQQLSRAQNHHPSARTKAPGKSLAPTLNFQVGDLVFLKEDKDKTKARDKYLITTLSDDRCQVRKFTKSQFRSKVYDVKLSDCYPVTSTTLARPVPGPVRGMIDHSDSDSEPDTSQPVKLQPHADQLGPVPVPHPPLPAAIVTPPLIDMQLRSPDTSASPSPSTAPDITPILPDPTTPSDTEADTTSQPTAHPNTTHQSTPLRRSTRARSRPSWQNCETWALE